MARKEEGWNSAAIYEYTQYSLSSPDCHHGSPLIVVKSALLVVIPKNLSKYHFLLRPRYIGNSWFCRKVPMTNQPKLSSFISFPQPQILFLRKLSDYFSEKFHLCSRWQACHRQTSKYWKDKNPARRHNHLHNQPRYQTWNLSNVLHQQYYRII